MSADFVRGGSDVIGMGHSLVAGMLLLVLLAEPAMAVQPESPWLYLSIAPDQIVSARRANPDPSPNLILSNMISQLPQAPDKLVPAAAGSTASSLPKVSPAWPSVVLQVRPPCWSVGKTSPT